MNTAHRNRSWIPIMVNQPAHGIGIVEILLFDLYDNGGAGALQHRKVPVCQRNTQSHRQRIVTFLARTALIGWIGTKVYALTRGIRAKTSVLAHRIGPKLYALIRGFSSHGRSVSRVVVDASGGLHQATLRATRSSALERKGPPACYSWGSVSLPPSEDGP